MDFQYCWLWFSGFCFCEFQISINSTRCLLAGLLQQADKKERGAWESLMDNLYSEKVSWTISTLKIKILKNDHHLHYHPWHVGHCHHHLWSHRFLVVDSPDIIRGEIYAGPGPPPSPAQISHKCLTNIIQISYKHILCRLVKQILPLHYWLRWSMAFEKY